MPEKVIGSGGVSNNIDVSSIETDVARIATELDLPEYDDSSNAVQSKGQMIYITGNSSESEGLYTHNGSGYVAVSSMNWA